MVLYNLLSPVLAVTHESTILLNALCDDIAGMTFSHIALNPLHHGIVCMTHKDFNVVGNGCQTKFSHTM